MRKTALYMLLVAAVLDMGGCGEANRPASADNGGTEVGTAEASIGLSISAGSVTENTPTNTGLEAMVDYINGNGGGTLKATDYYDTASRDATSMMQGLQQGIIDIGISGTACFSGLVLEVEIFQLPSLSNNLEEARTAVDGVASEKILGKSAEKGVVELVFWEGGFREFSNNARPATIPADLSGIKMGTLLATIQVETWEALGALPITTDTSELYTALQQGTISAEENPFHEIISRKFYEVQQYITLTDHVYTPFTVGINQKTQDKLGDQQKLAMADAANVGRETQRKADKEKTIETKQVLLGNECRVVENLDKETFKEVAASAWKIFTDENGTEFLDIIQKN